MRVLFACVFPKLLEGFLQNHSSDLRRILLISERKGGGLFYIRENR